MSSGLRHKASERPAELAICSMFDGSVWIWFHDVFFSRPLISSEVGGLNFFKDSLSRNSYSAVWRVCQSRAAIHPVEPPMNAPAMTSLRKW